MIQAEVNMLRIVGGLAACADAQRHPEPDIAEATDIAVCPDCEPGKPCEAHLAALAELVARANAPETEQ